MAPAVGGYCSPYRPILDEVEAAEAQGDIVRAIPGAQQAIIPGAAHMVSMQTPQEFNRLVLEFLADCPGSRW